METEAQTQRVYIFVRKPRKQTNVVLHQFSGAVRNFPVQPLDKQPYPDYTMDIIFVKKLALLTINLLLRDARSGDTEASAPSHLWPIILLGIL